MSNILARLKKVEDVCKKIPCIVLAMVDGEEREMTGEEYIKNPNAGFCKIVKCGRLQDDLEVVDEVLQRIRNMAFEAADDEQL